MNKHKGLLLVADVLLMILLIFLDQLTKHFAILYLKNQLPIKIIDKALELRYLENRGAAFGMLQNQKIFFILIAAIVIGVIFYVFIKTPANNKYIKLHIALVLIASGAIGNVIDRIRFDYVVDFIYFSLINFPIFNVADIYVTVSSVFLVILLLFIYKEEDLAFLSFRTKKYRDVK